jgi:Phage integrase, N-terminal SAM-like domain
MNELVLANRAADWRRLKMLVLDSVSSPITRRVYNLGLDEFFEWFGREPRSGFNKATVSTWRVALEARGLGSISINVRITAVRKLQSRRPITGCWRRNWRPVSRALRASSPRVSGLGTGYQCGRPRRS